MIFSEFWTDLIDLSNYLLIEYWWVILPVCGILGYLWYRFTKHFFLD